MVVAGAFISWNARPNGYNINLFVERNTAVVISI
jgi:hypothetical protein